MVPRYKKRPYKLDFFLFKRGGDNMKQFEYLDKRNASAVETDTLKEWKEKDILNLTIKNREGCQDFVFYDGPATANGMPKLHHMLAKFLKDTFCKYKTMQGYRVLRKVGWDTHGLPVELEVEKKLGFTSKQDIEHYGIEPFNQACKESVWENEKSFAELTERMGQFIDLKNPYITYKNDYIETEWWILKKFFEEGLFYEGFKILPYCSRCGTGLASHEVAQGYKEDTIDSVIVPMKKKDDDTYFLVWTTTPWTLISNVALCVNPDEDYVLAESKGHKFIVAAKLALKVLGEEYQVLETYKGKDLEYMEYEQLMPFLEVDKKAFYVTCDTYVTMEDGTGIVHMAPAFGADDYNVCRRYDLPALNPVDDKGQYTEGPWKGKFVIDADPEIVKYLKENEKLFRKERMVHNYPHCWRCDTPLIYYAKPSYYLAITKIKDKIVENNNKVHWHPAYVGEKRFGNWLENLNDWAISRNRYWGTPLPLWRCDCGHMEMIGSRKELIEKAIEKLDETVELHRPYVDDIHLKCEKCGKTMNRVTDVIDCWFDSGAMPFAQYHYPFENQELFENQFPADYICEGIDQTRGWFYTLIVISTFVKGVSPYKNVLVNDLLLDKFGKKMSKSKGNGVDPFDLIDKYGADTIRWYLPYVSPVWTPIKFDEDGLKEVYSKFFGTLKNTYNFFAMYANTDKIDPTEFHIDYKERPEIDRWLISKYNKLVKRVTKNMDDYNLTEVVRDVTDFVSEDLSNWYIRRNRRRFWASELTDDKKAVYNTTYEVLLGLTQLIAPITPFISEELYKKLTGLESVHLADYPKYDEMLISENIEKRMDLVRALISTGRYVREEASLKVRQPLKEALIDAKNESLISDLVPLIEEELNIKQVKFTKDLSTYIDFFVKPNFKVVGKIFGSKINDYSTCLENLNQEQITKLQNNESITIELLGETTEVTPEMVDIRISAKPGFNVGMVDNNCIILNTELTKELIEEGLARELVSKVQQLRKNKEFEITDRIHISYHSDDEFKQAMQHFEDYIKNETLATTIEVVDSAPENYDMNGHKVELDIKKVSE